jgi:DoxX-like family
MRLESLRQPIALVRGHILWSRYVIIVTDETMSNVTLLMTKLASSTDWSRRRLIAYWVITVLIATECLVGGMMGALRLPPFIGIMEHLGYAAYFMTIIGVCYMLAGVSLLAPRFPRLKEWAYAGLVFNYTGAAASHLAVGGSRRLHRPRGRFLGPASIRLAAPREPVREAIPVKLNQQRYVYEYISSSH